MVTERPCFPVFALFDLCVCALNKQHSRKLFLPSCSTSEQHYMMSEVAKSSTLLVFLPKKSSWVVFRRNHEPRETCLTNWRCHSGYGPPPVQIRQRIWTPLRRFGPPPTKLSFKASFVSYLVTNYICELFVDVLFNSNTTFLNKGKKKPSHFVPILPHLL